MNRSEGVVRERRIPGARDGRARTRRRRRRARAIRVSPRILIGFVALAAVLIGGWFWLRESSLVAVRKISVTGVSGPDATQIRSALRASARSMTTLDVNMSHLRTAVAPYPVVKALHVSTQFPHGIRIAVVEQVPVAVVVAPGRRITVSGDGTLLRDAASGADLPSITVGVAPGGTHVTGAARQQVRLLAAAPYPLLAKIGSVSSNPTLGLVAQLRNGPAIYFGGGYELRAKWDAAVQVLADSGSAGAGYIDVTDPGRPAAGPGTEGSSAGGSTSSATASTTTPATGSATPQSSEPGEE